MTHARRPWGDRYEEGTGFAATLCTPVVDHISLWWWSTSLLRQSSGGTNLTPVVEHISLHWWSTSFQRQPSCGAGLTPMVECICPATAPLVEHISLQWWECICPATAPLVEHISLQWWSTSLSCDGPVVEYISLHWWSVTLQRGPVVEYISLQWWSTSRWTLPTFAPAVISNCTLLDVPVRRVVKCIVEAVRQATDVIIEVLMLVPRGCKQERVVNGNAGFPLHVRPHRVLSRSASRNRTCKFRQFTGVCRGRRDSSICEVHFTST